MAGKKLTHTEVDSRVDTCLELRYNMEKPMLHREWIKYCHKHYGDKSEKQYTAYWMSAKERYDEGWRQKLNSMLEPAMDSLVELMYNEEMGQLFNALGIAVSMEYAKENNMEHLLV